MVLLKMAFIVVLILFVVSAISGLIGFFIDIIRYSQKHEKVKIIPSAVDDEGETDDGLMLDDSISIFGGEKYDTIN